MFVVTNTIASFKDYFYDRLKNIYEKSEVEQLFNLTFFYYKGWEKLQLRMSERELLSESELLYLRSIVKRLINAEPIQHIFGKTTFFDLEFTVTPSVLIPRQETEELVALILQKNHSSAKKLLDIGTGSGCIPIAIAANAKQLSVSALDVSEEALLIAQQNALANQVDLPLFCCDILNISDLSTVIPTPIDIIVSNPPYVTLKEKEQMHKNVLDFDPHLALFVADDAPLIFYAKISALAYQKLPTGGELYFEINEYFGQETVDLIKGYGFTKVSLLKDLNGKDRMIHAIK